jgi:hypothetical protein
MLLVVLMFTLVFVGITKVVHSMKQLKARISILEKLVNIFINGKKEQTKEAEKTKGRRGS